MTVDGDQHSRLGSPAMEETAIDDIMLGAPLNNDPNATSDAPPAAITALDPQSTETPLLRVEAGCAWDKENHSCAYNSVIMVFWFVCRKASPGWRNKWRQQAPEWNDLFETAFGLLNTMAQNKWTSKKALSHAFDVEQASIFYILHGTLILPWGRGSYLLVDGGRRERSDLSIHGCIQGIYT